MNQNPTPKGLPQDSGRGKHSQSLKIKDLRSRTAKEWLLYFLLKFSDLIRRHDDDVMLVP